MYFVRIPFFLYVKFEAVLDTAYRACSAMSPKRRKQSIWVASGGTGYPKEPGRDWVIKRG